MLTHLNTTYGKHTPKTSPRLKIKRWKACIMRLLFLRRPIRRMKNWKLEDICNTNTLQLIRIHNKELSKSIRERCFCKNDGHVCHQSSFREERVEEAITSLAILEIQTRTTPNEHKPCWPELQVVQLSCKQCGILQRNWVCVAKAIAA